MKIENLLYFYIAVCASMILFNIAYVFILRGNERRLEDNTFNFDDLIREQLMQLEAGLELGHGHMKLLHRRLKSVGYMTAFDRSMEAIYAENPEKADAYLLAIYPVFVDLSAHYHGKDTIRQAYFPYVVAKYRILAYREECDILNRIFELLRSENVYCRENAMRAVYTTKKAGHVARALKIIDETPHFHHPKLVCDGLLRFEGDREALMELLWSSFEGYSMDMQLNILNYFRFGDLRCDGRMLELLHDEGRNQELRFCAIRYFEKYPHPDARDALHAFAENSAGRTWEYQSIATAALKSYPGERTAEILKKNLSSSNWYVRRNAAISCDALGFSYSDLIHIFDGGDRYAREMMRYRFDRRRAEKEVG